MFSNKIKSSLDPLLEKYKLPLRNHMMEDNKEYVNAVNTLCEMIKDSAVMVGKFPAIKAARNLDNEIKLFCEGSYVTGLNYGPIIGLSDEEYERKIKISLMNARKPLQKTLFSLIDLSHSPGRIVYLPENIMEVKKQTSTGLDNAADYFFQSGVKRMNWIMDNFG